MAKKNKTNKTKWDAQWAEAKRKCRLNAETVRMAKEEDGFGDDEFLGDGLAGRWQDDPFNEQDVAEQNRRLLERQANFRMAAEWVAEEFSSLPAVRKVVLFGSVAVALKKEIPRFREYRKAGVAVWHECQDVDLAVWMDDLSDLKRLQKVRSRALNNLHGEMNRGVAHHQVDVFIFESATDRYQGRLCGFAKCPKGKPPCHVPGCGDVRFLQQHEGFKFRKTALAPERVVVLYDRDQAGGGDREEEWIPF